MKHLITTNDGGFPLVLDDFRWMQSNVEEIIPLIHSAICGATPNEVIVYNPFSITVDGTTTTVGEGAVFINGELMNVPSHSFDNSQAYKWWSVSDYYDPSGLKQFQNSSIHEAYLIRYAQITSGATLPIGAIPYTGNEDTLISKIKARLGLTPNTIWLTLPDCPYEVVDSAGSPMYYIDELGFVHFKGAYTVETPSSGNKLIGTLPVGPNADIQFPYIHGSNGDSSVSYYMFRILTSGEIRNVAPYFPGKVVLSAFPSIRLLH